MATLQELLALRAPNLSGINPVSVLPVIAGSPLPAPYTAGMKGADVDAAWAPVFSALAGRQAAADNYTNQALQMDQRQHQMAMAAHDAQMAEKRIGLEGARVQLAREAADREAQLFPAQLYAAQLKNQQAVRAMDEALQMQALKERALEALAGKTMDEGLGDIPMDAFYALTGNLTLPKDPMAQLAATLASREAIAAMQEQGRNERAANSNAAKMAIAAGNQATSQVNKELGIAAQNFTSTPYAGDESGEVGRRTQANVEAMKKAAGKQKEETPKPQKVGGMPAPRQTSAEIAPTPEVAASALANSPLVAPTSTPMAPPAGSIFSRDLLIEGLLSHPELANSLVRMLGGN